MEPEEQSSTSSAAKRKPRALVPNEKLLILNAYNYNRMTLNVKQCAIITAEMTGVSVQSVYRVLRENRTAGEFTPPKKPGPKKNALEKLNKKTISALRQKVIDYLSQEEYPNILKITNIVTADPDLPNYSKSTVARILKLLDIKYGMPKKRCGGRPDKKNDIEQVLIEPDINYIYNFENEERLNSVPAPRFGLLI